MGEWKVTGVVRTIYRPTQEDDSAAGRQKPYAEVMCNESR